jgi:hypothetical protein
MNKITKNNDLGNKPNQNYDRAWPRAQQDIKVTKMNDNSSV